MAQRLDSLIQDYGGSPISLVNGTIWNGPMMSLQGALGCSAIINSPNTAAGSMFLLCTNFYNYQPGFAVSGGYTGFPVFFNGGNANFSAGGSQAVAANINNNGTYYANWWISIQCTATGTVFLATNTRRGT